MLEDSAAVPLYGGVTALTALLPLSEPVTAGFRWTLAKAGKVAADGTVSGTNPSGLKLTYASGSGLFKGAFTVYYPVNGRLVKTKAVVTGAAVNGAGYGAAVINKAASLPAAIQ